MLAVNVALEGGVGVGGIRGMQELERGVDSDEMADAGQVMPPKSTWFEPKLADGLVSHVLD